MSTPAQAHETAIAQGYTEGDVNHYVQPIVGMLRLAAHHGESIPPDQAERFAGALMKGCNAETALLAYLKDAARTSTATADTGLRERVEALRATMPHALDCGIPCNCWKRWLYDALSADATAAPTTDTGCTCEMYRDNLAEYEPCPVHDDDTEIAGTLSQGCDCTELCSMGPTCPGGMLARLPGSGCWRTATADAHRSSYPMGNKNHGTPEHPDWGTFCVECKESWPCDVSLLAARLADAEARAEAAVVLPDDEALAELLSWTTGDFTRWSPTAHPDHNRWSWRGEGHGDTMRQHYRDAARRLREALRGDQ